MLFKEINHLFIHYLDHLSIKGCAEAGALKKN